VSKVALAQKVSRISVFKLMQKYKEDGWDGLRDHKTGRREITLNEKVAESILNLRNKYRYGPGRIEQILKKQGFCISHRQIEKLLLRNNLVVPNVKKQKSRKWVRYELPNPNDLWHTDWTHCPFTDKEFCAYIDDRTRLITAFGIFKRQTTENSVALLRAGISDHGKPKAVMTDHGVQYYANHPNAIQEHTQFRIALDALGIKHCLARKNHPQTNGKIERFFLTYKTEFMVASFATIEEFIRHYNEERPHMSLNHKTPGQVWGELRG